MEDFEDIISDIKRRKEAYEALTDADWEYDELSKTSRGQLVYDEYYDNLVLDNTRLIEEVEKLTAELAKHMSGKKVMHSRCTTCETYLMEEGAVHGRLCVYHLEEKHVSSKQKFKERH